MTSAPSLLQGGAEPAGARGAALGAYAGRAAEPQVVPAGTQVNGFPGIRRLLHRHRITYAVVFAALLALSYYAGASHYGADCDRKKFSW